MTYDTTPEGFGKTSENTDTTEGAFLELFQEAKIVQSARFDSNDPAFADEMI
ncbi:hypothetical protein [Planococcus sp. ISL-109]|uniref:hypothetical protein n=1 Tax=Planococcus sp. ISL-109 TaxID=2819166 RepID=UPI002035562F|nr:hypothetical protein [Planococcus sp. ISL-109]